MRKLVFVAGAVAALAGGAAECSVSGFDRPWVIVAEDFGSFFRSEKNEMTKEGLEEYADELLAGGKVTHAFWCPIAGCANFDAKATDPVWAKLGEPTAEFGVVRTENGLMPLDRPETIAANRRWVENAKKLHDAGVDPYRVLIDRTRANGASPWLSIRMPDMLFSCFPNHFLAPSYFVKHPDLLIKPGHGGGSPEFGRAESRAWFARVVAEVAGRYKDVDGIEIDIVTRSFWLFGSAPEPGSLPRHEMFARYLADLKKSVVEQTGNPAVKLALRVLHDRNLLDGHFGKPNVSFPVDVLIPLPDTVRLQPLLGWAEKDRYEPFRVMPAVSVAGMTVPQLAGRLSWIRGCGFPGVMIFEPERASAAVRNALLKEGLADLRQGVRGPREIGLVRDEYLMEWKRAAWGYVDIRGTYPWKLDKPWKYEFALQEGSVAEKGVVAEMSYNSFAVPPAVYLNGRKSTFCRKNGSTATYGFPKDAVLGGVNQLYVPAVESDEFDLEEETENTPSVTGAIVKIDE